MLQRDFTVHMQKLFPTKLPRAVIGCSGGLDSMVLLNLMTALYRSQAIGAGITACYINHQQRPSHEIQCDIDTIRAECARQNIDFEIRAIQLPSHASEARMRQARYEALASVDYEGKSVLFTAHHADDQLETYLLRLLRGAHPETLKGMSARVTRDIKGTSVTIARPLLLFHRQALLDYAKKNAISWQEDSTNEDPRYARNRIRRQLIPLLDDWRPGAAKRLLDFFEALSSHHNSASLDKNLKLALQSGIGYDVKNLDFKSLKTVLDECLGSDAQRTSKAHWESLKKQLLARQVTKQGGGPKKILQFPGGYALFFKGTKVFWSRI